MRDIELLHPEMRALCREFVKRCEAHGLKAKISETYRTKAEQDALYAIGRTKPGSIVTNARYPYSAHCWGLAFDIYRGDGRNPYYNSDGWFEKCGKVGKALGLFWGGDFKSIKDRPHFELPKYLPNNSCKTLIARYGTPEAFKKTWEEVETVTQADFDKMMDNWLARRNALPTAAWAEAELEEAIDEQITDGTRPQAFATRQEVAIMVKRATK